jgi:enoyl-CoA hydratase/carnithine racemase
MAAEYAYLSIEREETILWVTINRTQDRNSINSPLMAEVSDLLERTERTDVRAVVFTGAGDTHFIGGADGIEMMRLGPEEARLFSRRIQELFNRMEASPIITVAAIDGLCFGGGYEFAMACDLRIATEQARIGLPEVKVGLIPGGGGTQRLPRLVGVGRALGMILSGKLYSGRDAENMGLVHITVERDRLKEGVKRLLEPILAQPHYALALAKRSVYASQYGSMTDGLASESELFSRCLKRDFFPELMRKQLTEGTLTTTEDVSRFLKKERS